MNMSEFLSSLGPLDRVGLDDLNYDSTWDHSEVAEEKEVAEEEMEEEEVAEEEMAEEEMAGDEELEEVTEANTRSSRSRTHECNQVEDIALFYAWMNISMDATIGTDQTKTMFWERITDHYNNSVDVRSSRTQGSLGHRWSTIHDQCNRWSDCINQVNHAPPSGVQVAEYGPYIQELFKHRNTKFGHKPFTLHHCYKELCKNEKWIQRIAETTPKRSRLSISIEEDNEVDEDANNRLEGNKIAKERKKRNAFGDTYKEELVAKFSSSTTLSSLHLAIFSCLRWATNLFLFQSLHRVLICR